MLTGNDIRTKFLEFFESKGHTIVPSSSLVPSNDPTLMFVNSGMVQFKNTFLGLEQRDYKRATTSQRCVRAGGKHNDLENVGHTARHHTFFEMLGNFSFGDYFKEDAINYAWEFVTEVLGLPKERLCVTIYHTDEEAYKIWRSVGVPDEDIIRIDTSDNFWTMGDDGPCGPCTEIFYDHGEQYWGGRPGTPEEDGDRFIEIWNLVFMQNIMEGGKIVGDLPLQCVDTGMGLERITAVAQHVNSNYQIDIIQDIIQEASKLSGIPYGKNQYSAQTQRKIDKTLDIPAEEGGIRATIEENYDAQAKGEKDSDTDTAFHVIADHVRCMSFLLTDGVMPSNEGRGYVLRRIMRRAMRYVTLLGIYEPFIYKLVPVLVKVMGDAYPELARAQKMIEDVIHLEEERFGRTLSKGLKILDQETLTLKSGDTLDGTIAFKLYDTYGFPLDLTQDALRARNIGIDEDGFNACMEEQRAKARAAHKGTGDAKLADVWFDLQDTTAPADFLGYDTLEVEAQCTALVKGSDTRVERLKAGEEGVALFNQTPFYAESGGQVADTGEIVWEGGRAVVSDTQKILDGAIWQHKVKVVEGTLAVDTPCELKVDEKRRHKIMANHSVTHLLHAALHDVLGDHVFQKGSLVTEEKTRFDFSHMKALTPEEIRAIEKHVNTNIWGAGEVVTRLMDKDAAVEAGAMALFGEKYDDEVRVVSMGDKMSVELCGGTHVKNTSDIGVFKLVTDSSISAGVRRVEGVTGDAAMTLMHEAEDQLKAAAAQLKAAPAEVVSRIEALQKEVKQLKQAVKEAKKSGGGASGASPAELVEKAEEISGVRFVGATLDGMDPALLREMVDDLKVRLGSGVIVLATNNGEKATVVAGVTKDLVGTYKAGDIVNAAAATLGGKGGGRPDMAMAGGKAGDLDAALTAARSTLGG